MHVLLDLTPAERLVDIGSGRDRDLFSAKRKRHRLDDRGPSVDPQQDIAAHWPDFAVAGAESGIMRPALKGPNELFRPVAHRFFHRLPRLITFAMIAGARDLWRCSSRLSGPAATRLPAQREFCP